MQETPNVGYIRDELAALKSSYTMILDCISGQKAVKDRRDEYLPRPNMLDNSPENTVRYQRYLERAVYYNYCRRTIDGLVGQVFMRPAVVEYPDIMAAVIKNATGNGVSLELLAKQSMNFTLALSRGGVFVDYPRVGDEATSIADLESGYIRPTINFVSPLNIINWRTRDIGAEEVLSLIVIAEQYCAYDDGFEMKQDEQWRVLGLDENNLYYQEIWKLKKSKNGRTLKNQYERVELIYPKDASGQYLGFIPFQFMGSLNNDSNPDNPNFYDLASLNIAHYRNSADYEESVYTGGQPTLVIIGVDDQWAKDNQNTGKVGSLGGIALPAQGDAKFIQPTPNTLVKDAMEMKVKQMVALGARMLEAKNVQRTATEASIDSISESSILASTARNVSEAIDRALKWAATFIGVNPELVSFALNTDFEVAKLKSDERRQLVEEWQKGLLTFEEARAVMTKAGLATEDSQLAKEKIDAEAGAQLEELEATGIADMETKVEKAAK